MKRWTFDILLAGTLAMAPAAWAQANPDDQPNYLGGDDAGVAPGMGASTASAQNDSPAPMDYNSNRNGAGVRNSSQAPDLEPYNPQAPSGTGLANPGGTAANTTATGTQPATINPDMEVAQKLHQANLDEIAMAQMALDKGQSAEVKSYARKLISDHQTADSKLMAYVDRKGFDRSKIEEANPTTSATSDDAHNRLQNASGPDFDRQFANVMIDEHDKAIHMVRTARATVTDKELREMLGSLLPKLEQHRRMAQELADKFLKTSS